MSLSSPARREESIRYRKTGQEEVGSDREGECGNCEDMAGGEAILLCRQL